MTGRRQEVQGSLPGQEADSDTPSRKAPRILILSQSAPTYLAASEQRGWALMPGVSPGFPETSAFCQDSGGPEPMASTGLSWVTISPQLGAGNPTPQMGANIGDSLK